MKITFYLFSLLITLNVTGQSHKYSWSKQFGGTSYDEVNKVTTDAAGNVYVLGQFYGTADMDPGPGVTSLTSGGNGRDLFLSKFDANGTFVWSKVVAGGGIYGDEKPAGVAVRNNGYIYVAASFIGNVDLDPGVMSYFPLTYGNYDMFLSVLNSNGDFIGAITMGGGYDDNVNDLTLVDGTGFYLTGSFRGTVNFDPTGTNELTAPQSQAFVARYNFNGSLVWAKHLVATSIGGSAGNSVKVDASGNVFTAGYFQDVSDFDPGSGVVNLPWNGNRDIFVTKLDADGNYVWARAFGSSVLDEANAIAFSGNDVLIGGNFAGPIDFDPGPNAAIISATLFNGFLCKLTSDGNYVWAGNMGGPVSSVASDSEGNSYVAGVAGMYSDLNPGAGTFMATSFNTEEGFITKVTASHEFGWAKVIGSTSGYEKINHIHINGNDEIYSVGYFSGSTDFNTEGGVDQVSAAYYDAFVHKLITCTPSLATDVQTHCGSYTWVDGVTYTTSNNTATYMLTNSTGCDSIVTLNLTINLPSASTDEITSCEPITWIDGITYTTSNTTATHTLTSVNGCDSVITLNLIISDYLASISEDNGILSSHTADAYQWINCADNSLIAGATNQSFTPTENGSYAVIAFDNNCPDTSDCITISGIGLHEFSGINGIKAYPNPTSGAFTLQLDEMASHVSITIYTIDGQIILNKEVINTAIIPLEIDRAKGVYLVEVVLNKTKKENLKLFIQE